MLAGGALQLQPAGALTFIFDEYDEEVTKVIMEPREFQHLKGKHTRDGHFPTPHLLYGRRKGFIAN
jgi:hypothetical protein